MKLENAFTIDAPADEVWSTMLDFERVAGCVPGGEVVGTAQDGGLEATIKVKVGPMAMSYRGIVQIVEQDMEARRAVMDAKARETRGQGKANASMVMQVQDGSPVRVSIVTDLDVTGRVAQMGHGVMQDVAGRIVDGFAKNLQAMMTTSHADAEQMQTPPTGVAHATVARDEPLPAAAADSTGARDERPARPTLQPMSATHVKNGGAALSVRDLILAVIRGRSRAIGQWLRRVVASIPR